MARRMRSSALETRSRKTQARDPQKTLLAKARRRLVARLPAQRRAGHVVHARRQRQRRQLDQAIAPADDYEGTQGALTFWDAQLRAREIARGSAVDDSNKPNRRAKPSSAYARDLASRGGGHRNATWVIYHLTPSLGSKLVAQLNARELRHWRDSLLDKGLTAASVTPRLQVAVRRALARRRP